jgi:2-dehydro-3-deoxygalactonokinase
MIKNVLSCDWGTSSFRLRLIDVENCTVLAETADSEGIAAVHKKWIESGLDKDARIDFYKTVLLSYIKKIGKTPMSGVPIIISGMASSSMGMIELPYHQTPFVIHRDKLNLYKILPDRHVDHEIWLVSGLRTAADVMRGEETMLLGCALEKNAPQLFIFPGTHSKQVLIEGSVVKDFKTYMTGELFDLTSSKSILANGLERNDQFSGKNKAFIKGVRDSSKGNLLNGLFHVRTNDLFKKFTKKENYYYLSGLLIGEELKSIQQETYDMVHLVSTGRLLALYSDALSALGFDKKVRTHDAARALILGQVSIFKNYQ